MDNEAFVWVVDVQGGQKNLKVLQVILVESAQDMDGFAGIPAWNLVCKSIYRFRFHVNQPSILIRARGNALPKHTMRPNGAHRYRKTGCASLPTPFVLLDDSDRCGQRGCAPFAIGANRLSPRLIGCLITVLHFSGDTLLASER